ncbi:unnamed protein product [Bursaphelenchus okinawaensis]|uniref:Uncharacterized protein n=1 Tax=Bursaphelenchus okinawaensis TaxID=465554 RepID=A0A811K5Z7_9BILA|nr:unnamed protein product [Bursaphelenchus okinawaensis]CAG9092043.1 unnamed protein product [Bursaphelenchus okinawaensis]
MKLIVVVALLTVVVAGEGTQKEECEKGVALSIKALEPIVKDEKKRHETVELIRQHVKDACSKHNECDEPCYKNTFSCLDEQYNANTIVISGLKCCKGCPAMS